MKRDGGEWLVEAEGLARHHVRGREVVRALDDVSLRMRRGEFVAVVGPSGCGKTTLLNVVGCMDVPTAGSLRIDGESVAGLPESGRTRLRRHRLGFVFQHFGLVPTLTVAENVGLPGLFAGRDVRRRVDELIARMGLEGRRDHRPHELAGGEMQRVAIARALINDPCLLLADEPTGNLDTATGRHVMATLEELHRGGLTMLVVTHNEELASRADRRLWLRDGRVERWD